MDNPETLETFEGRHRTKTNKTKNTTYQSKNEPHPNKTGMKLGAQKGPAVCFYKTPAVLLIINPVKVLSVIEERKMEVREKSSIVN